MLSRRQLLELGLATGAGLLAPWGGLGFLPRRAASPAYAAIPGGSLDPTTIEKYVMPLVVPPAMPATARGAVDYYEIAVRQFQQQILPTGSPMTTVWSYGSVNHPGTFNYPAFTIEARFNRPVRVKWINDLKDANGNFLPHLLPVDPTLHWANPPGGVEGRDMRPAFEETPGAYTGPVPIVTHLHGGHNAQERHGVAWDPGTATFQYENDQRAGTFWYHDHTLGTTRANVYAGPAGFYLLRRGPADLPPAVLPGPAPAVGAEPFARYYEIPLAIQDRSFNADGSLFYPDSRRFFDGFRGPYIPEGDVPPIWNPEFFGNTMVVNGRTWPFLEVERRRYRFRVLNGCNSRFLILKVLADALASRPASPALPFWQIGSDGGFLPKPVQLDQLLLGPAERADVIVDFSGVPEGTALHLVNEGPDEPFGGGVPVTDFPPADPDTTGQVMKLVVVPATSRDTSMDPARLTLPAFKPLGPATSSRRVSLNEQGSTVPGFGGPIAALLGTLDAAGAPVAKGWDDAITENPTLNSIEVWEIHNSTEDAHPIHIHELQFQVVDRQPFDGDARPPESWETAFKDTVIAYPGEVTRVRALFDLPGLFVWHCHILEHEDNEMMRPYFVGPNPPAP